jgi:hypothetical protein
MLAFQRPQGHELLTELVLSAQEVERKAKGFRDHTKSMRELFPFTPRCSKCGADTRQLYQHEMYCPANGVDVKYAKARLAEELIHQAIAIAPHFPGSPKEKAQAAIETVDSIVDAVLERIRGA